MKLQARRSWDRFSGFVALGQYHDVEYLELGIESFYTPRLAVSLTAAASRMSQLP